MSPAISAINSSIEWHDRWQQSNTWVAAKRAAGRSLVRRVERWRETETSTAGNDTRYDTFSVPLTKCCVDVVCHTLSLDASCFVCKLRDAYGFFVFCHVAQKLRLKRQNWMNAQRRPLLTRQDDDMIRFDIFAISRRRIKKKIMGHKAEVRRPIVSFYSLYHRWRGDEARQKQLEFSAFIFSIFDRKRGTLEHQ